MTDTEPLENVRATFVMRREARDLLRQLAGRYGVSQSEIMNQAPFLYAFFAERSLSARRADLGRIEFLARKAQEALRAMPRHVIDGSAHDEIECGLEIERRSIERRQVRGPNAETIYEIFRSDGYLPRGNPFAEMAAKEFENAGLKALAARYRQLFAEADSEGWDSFADEDEEARREAALNELVLDLDLDRPAEEQGHPTVIATETTARWRLHLGDEIVEARSGGEVLAAFTRWLQRRSPKAFERVAAEAGGRKRPLLAKAPEALYPDRPDLAGYSLPAAPGWYVGTNYSRRDIHRLLRQAAEMAGLVWSVDIMVQSQERVDP